MLILDNTRPESTTFTAISNKELSIGIEIGGFVLGFMKGRVLLNIPGKGSLRENEPFQIKRVCLWIVLYMFLIIISKEI